MAHQLVSYKLRRCAGVDDLRAAREQLEIVSAFADAAPRGRAALAAPAAWRAAARRLPRGVEPLRSAGGWDGCGLRPLTGGTVANEAPIDETGSCPSSGRRRREATDRRGSVSGQHAGRMRQDRRLVRYQGENLGDEDCQPPPVVHSRTASPDFSRYIRAELTCRRRHQKSRDLPLPSRR